MPTVVGVQDASRPRVALVHDFLLDLRGAERVFLAMCDVWPEADIYTAVYNEEGTEGRFSHRNVHSSFLQRLGPTARTFRTLLPLYPAAIESFDFSEYDLVVSSSSAWAHADHLRRADHPRLLLPQPLPVRMERPRPHARRQARAVRGPCSTSSSAAGANGTGSPPSAWIATSRTRAPPRRGSGTTGTATRSWSTRPWRPAASSREPWATTTWCSPS